jgi:hypothetical protein
MMPRKLHLPPLGIPLSSPTLILTMKMMKRRKMMRTRIEVIVGM